MLGAIIGDIAGSRYEFNATNDYNFELFSSKSDFTDDTVCTFGVAGALINPKYTFGQSIHYWCRKYPAPKGGYGMRFHDWVMSEKPEAYGSFGNGSAMRVSSIGWWYDSRDEVLEAAKATAECSHSHPEGIKGAQTVALAVWLAVQARLSGKAPDAGEIVNECAKFSGYDIDIDWKKVRNRFDETCQGTVPVALAIIRDSKSFEDAIRRAVSLGADADTLGAIVGGIAEPIWGIPQWIKEKALSYLTSEMLYTLRRFRSGVRERRALAKVEKEKLTETLLLWKLGLGDMGKYFNGEDATPAKDIVATSESWKTEPMPHNGVTANTFIELSVLKMDILRRGHLPEAMEDHWFMYCDDSCIRYYRSWTGMCVFEARYVRSGELYMIDSVTYNPAISDMGVPGKVSAMCLFRYLIEAETGGDSQMYWDNFIRARRIEEK